MGMAFAPTWLRQVSPPASQNHFNHWEQLTISNRMIPLSMTLSDFCAGFQGHNYSTLNNVHVM